MSAPNLTLIRQHRDNLERRCTILTLALEQLRRDNMTESGGYNLLASVRDTVLEMIALADVMLGEKVQ